MNCPKTAQNHIHKANSDYIMLLQMYEVQASISIMNFLYFRSQLSLLHKLKMIIYHKQQEQK